MREKRLLNNTLTVLSVLLLLFAVGTVQYFIWSDLFIAEFDSDNAQTIFFADASIRSRSLLNKDFFYSGQIQPLGYQFIFVPVVKLFGVTMFSLRLGLCIQSIFCIGLLYLFLRSLGFDRSVSPGITGIIILFLSATEEMRDIFWTYIIYYNMSVIFSLGAFVLLARYYRNRKTLWLILFSVWTLIGCCNGSVLLALFAIPLLGCVVPELLFSVRNAKELSERRKDLIPILAIVICIPAGLFFYKKLTADIYSGYMDDYLMITAPETWSAHLDLFFLRWTELFLKPSAGDTPFFSTVGVKMLIRLGASILILGLSFGSILVYPRVKDRFRRCWLIFNVLLNCITLFLFAFGTISSSCHRLTPMVFSGIISSLILLDTLITESERQFGVRAVSGTVSAFLVFAAGTFGLSILRQKPDISYLTAQDSILKTLLDHGLTYGYCTDFEFSNSLTLLTDNTVKVRYMHLEPDGLYIRPIHNYFSWYDDQPGQDRFFLVCLEQELAALPELAETALEQIRITQYSPSIGREKGYYLLIYDHNIMENAGLFYFGA